MDSVFLLRSAYARHRKPGTSNKWIRNAAVATLTAFIATTTAQLSSAPGASAIGNKLEDHAKHDRKGVRFMAKVKIPGGKGSGFFVGPRTVVTAAHVVEDENPTGVQISYIDEKGEGQTVDAVRKIFMNSEYKANLEEEAAAQKRYNAALKRLEDGRGGKLGSVTQAQIREINEEYRNAGQHLVEARARVTETDTAVIVLDKPVTDSYLALPNDGTVGDPSPSGSKMRVFGWKEPNSEMRDTFTSVWKGTRQTPQDFHTYAIETLKKGHQWGDGVSSGIVTAKMGQMSGMLSACNELCPPGTASEELAKMNPVDTILEGSPVFSGDSGGPLIAIDRSGRPVVVGINQSGGSQEAHWARIDGVRDALARAAADGGEKLPSGGFWHGLGRNLEVILPSVGGGVPVGGGMVGSSAVGKPVLSAPAPGGGSRRPFGGQEVPGVAGVGGPAGGGRPSASADSWRHALDRARQDGKARFSGPLARFQPMGEIDPVRRTAVFAELVRDSGVNLSVAGKSLSPEEYVARVESVSSNPKDFISGFRGSWSGMGDLRKSRLKGPAKASGVGPLDALMFVPPAIEAVSGQSDPQHGRSRLDNIEFSFLKATPGVGDLVSAVERYKAGESIDEILVDPFGFNSGQREKERYAQSFPEAEEVRKHRDEAWEQIKGNYSWGMMRAHRAESRGSQAWVLYKAASEIAQKEQEFSRRLAGAGSAGEKSALEKQREEAVAGIRSGLQKRLEAAAEGIDEKYAKLAQENLPNEKEFNSAFSVDLKNRMLQYFHPATPGGTSTAGGIVSTFGSVILPPALGVPLKLAGDAKSAAVTRDLRDKFDANLAAVRESPKHVLVDSNDLRRSFTHARMHGYVNGSGVDILKTFIDGDSARAEGLISQSKDLTPKSSEYTDKDGVIHSGDDDKRLFGDGQGSSQDISETLPVMAQNLVRGAGGGSSVEDVPVASAVKVTRDWDVFADGERRKLEAANVKTREELEALVKSGRLSPEVQAEVDWIDEETQHRRKEPEIKGSRAFSAVDNAVYQGLDDEGKIDFDYKKNLTDVTGTVTWEEYQVLKDKGRFTPGQQKSIQDIERQRTTLLTNLAVSPQGRPTPAQLEALQKAIDGSDEALNGTLADETLSTVAELRQKLRAAGVESLTQLWDRAENGQHGNEADGDERATRPDGNDAPAPVSKGVMTPATAPGAAGALSQAEREALQKLADGAEQGPEQGWDTRSRIQGEGVRRALAVTGAGSVKELEERRTSGLLTAVQEEEIRQIAEDTRNRIDRLDPVPAGDAGPAQHAEASVAPSQERLVVKSAGDAGLSSDLNAGGAGMGSAIGKTDFRTNDPAVPVPGVTAADQGKPAPVEAPAEIHAPVETPPAEVAPGVGSPTVGQAVPVASGLYEQRADVLSNSNSNVLSQGESTVEEAWRSVQQNPGVAWDGAKSALGTVDLASMGGYTSAAAGGPSWAVQHPQTQGVPQPQPMTQPEAGALNEQDYHVRQDVFPSGSGQGETAYPAVHASAVQQQPQPGMQPQSAMEQYQPQQAETPPYQPQDISSGSGGDVGGVSY